jgi:hypothetical protein
VTGSKIKEKKIGREKTATNTKPNIFLPNAPPRNRDNTVKIKTP